MMLVHRLLLPDSQQSAAPEDHDRGQAEA